jgi:hypothetical protein
MKYVVIDTDSLASQIIPEYAPEFPGVPAPERYAPDFLARCVAVKDDADVLVGDIWGGGSFLRPELGESG